MNTPEAGLPADPFLELDFPKSPALEELFNLGLARGIIEQLAANDFAREAYVLTRVCTRMREDGNPEPWIDEFAIGFAQKTDQKVYEDAMVAWIILNPDTDIAI